MKPDFSASLEKDLICYKLRTDSSANELCADAFLIYKFAFIGNARTFAMLEDGYYVLVLSFLDRESADAVRENIRNNVAIVEHDLPKDVAKLRPWARVLPKEVSQMLQYRLAMDEDLIQSTMAMTAERMDRDPQGDYIFPNLSAEDYAKIKLEGRKKPH
jgi:hypothetical protein